MTEHNAGILTGFHLQLSISDDLNKENYLQVISNFIKACTL